MTRYDIPEERIFIIGGRDRRGKLILEDRLSSNTYVANPERRSKKELIEMPLGKFEDLRVRIGLIRSASHGKYPDVQIRKSNDIYELMSPMSSEPQEVLSVVLLDTKNVVIGICEVSRGGISSTVVEAQTIFKPVILSNATGIIIVHNHPSGNIEHSPDDIKLSGVVEESAKMLGIRMLDFVIIGHKEYKSFADEGII